MYYTYTKHIFQVVFIEIKVFSLTKIYKDYCNFLLLPSRRRVCNREHAVVGYILTLLLIKNNIVYFFNNNWDEKMVASSFSNGSLPIIEYFYEVEQLGKYWHFENVFVFWNFSTLIIINAVRNLWIKNFILKLKIYIFIYFIS